MITRTLFAALSLWVLCATLACEPTQKEREPAREDTPTTSKTKDAPRPEADDEESSAGEPRRDPTEPYVPMPRTSELAVPKDALEALLAAARAGCDGKKLATVTRPSSMPAAKPPIIGVLYGEDGKRVRSVRVDDDVELFAKAHDVGGRLCKGGDAKGFVHLLVLTQQAHLLNFGIKGMFDNKVFEPQVTGIAYRLDGKRFELDPLEQLEKNMGPNDARNALAKGIGIDAKSMPGRVNLTMELYRTAHVGEGFPSKAPVRFFRGHKIFTHEDLTHEVLQERLKLIGEWYRNNVIDGEVTYAYVPSRQAYSNQERTMVRSTMSTWILNRLAVALDDEGLQKKGDEVINFYFERYFNMAESKKAGRINPSTKPLANGNLVENRWTVASFIAAACNERKDREKYRTEMDLLMKWAATHQRPDGFIWAPEGGEQYFMPGQFLLPVAYFYRDTKDPIYREIFDKAFAVYEPNLMQMMDFGPEWHAPYAPAWFTQPLAQMYLLTKEDKYKDLIFAINDRVAHAYETNARLQVYYDYDGILAPKAGSMGNNSVTAASLEALTDAAIVARAAGDQERFRKYQAIIRRATTYLLRLQFIPENTYYIQKRERVVGGFKNDLVNTRSWMDSVWHLTSAFLKIQEHRLLDP